jgi:hypothetical protein
MLLQCVIAIAQIETFLCWNVGFAWTGSIRRSWKRVQMIDGKEKLYCQVFCFSRKDAS